MKQSGHLNPSEETGTGFLITSKYGRNLSNKHGYVGRQQQQLKHLGPKANKWLHTMLNVCFTGNKMPKIWRQPKIIAILKPGKDSTTPMRYRPISILCHTYKLYERIILNRIMPVVEQRLINEQAGFRTGSHAPASC